MNDMQQLKKIIEGALFAANEPLNIDKIISLFEEHEIPEHKTIAEAIKSLQEDYHDGAIELKELCSGYHFQVRAELAPWIKRLWQERPARYSRALMETLVLIAYKQPITRAEIEQIRGVAVSTQIVKTLEDHGWIRTVGHKEVPGRPALLATTKQFLDHFGMKSLSELPPLDSLREVELMEKNLQQELNLNSQPEEMISNISLSEEGMIDEGTHEQNVSEEMISEETTEEKNS
jgi:segregation and condensation protein B